MSRYYNGAALRGGWNFGSAPITGAAVPSLTDLANYGAQLALEFPDDVAAAWNELVERLMEEGKITNAGNATANLGLLATADALRIQSRNPNADDAQRKLAEVKYRLLKMQYNDAMDMPAFRSIRRFMHPPIKRSKQERAALRAPALDPGPYVPYTAMSYFPAPPKKWKFTRNRTTTEIPLSDGTWTSLPTAYTSLPTIDRHRRMDKTLKAALRKTRADWYAQQGRMV